MSIQNDRRGLGEDITAEARCAHEETPARHPLLSAG